MTNNILLQDLKLTRRDFDRQVSDRETVDLITSASGDLQTVSARANLAQAIINRLFTRKGELTKLGHANYGSRLYQLIGELNNTRVKGLAELYVRESLAAESRIEAITHIDFAPASRGIDRDVLTITVSVKPVGQDELISVTIPISLGGGV